MGILDGISQSRARVTHVQDSNVFEVRAEDGDALLLNLAGLGIDPIDVKIGDHVMVTRTKKGRIADVKPL